MTVSQGFHERGYDDMIAAARSSVKRCNNVLFMQRAVRGLTAALVLLTFPIIATHAQATDAGGDESTSVSGYRIAAVDYVIDGRTRQWILDDLLDLDIGLEFASLEALEAHLERQQQVLINQRALQDADVDYVLGDLDEESVTAVSVTVTTDDTWNLIVLPYFRYDSNTGLLLSVRGRDYNLFGTLQEFAIDFDYERTDDDEDLFTVAFNFSLPFNLFEQRWRLIGDQKLEIKDGEFDFELSTGLGYAFDWVGLGWEAVYTQTYNYLTDDDEGDDYYFTSRFGLGTSLDTPVHLPGFGVLQYRPGVYTQTSYRPDGISEEREGVSAGFDHRLSAGGFDWVGNYRRGRTVRLGNDNEYNITKDEWDAEINFRVSVYRPLWQPSPEVWPKAGVSASFSSFYLIDGADIDLDDPDDTQDDAARDARGVADDAMNGDLGVFLNLDAVVTVWTLEPIFEAQFGVFFDVAYVRDLRGDFYESSSFDAERDLKYGAGIELIGFPLFARSLYLRGSLGFDLRRVAEGEDPLDGNVREIFIGLGHHY